MRVLITGGAGFIGSHLSDYLVNLGQSVIVLDDLSTGSMNNVAHLLPNTNFNFCSGSIEDETLLTKLLAQVDIVVHLAAVVGVRLVMESPVRTIEANVRGTETLMRCVAGTKKLVFLASTSEVYGKRPNGLLSEDDDLILGPPSRGRWSYACSKAIDEFLALAYWKEKGVPCIIARFFNTVGPRQTGRYGMVVPTFVQQALRNNKITVFGDGMQRRCFCHVSDVVDAIWRLICNPAAVGEVFNIGSTEEISILELAYRTIQATNSDSPVEIVPYHQAYADGFEDMHRRVPSLAKIAALIGFRPQRDLSQILLDVASYERHKMQADISESLAGA